VPGPRDPAVNIPPFSIFSAVTELFVTAGVLTVVWRNWNRRQFPFGLFLGVVLFEGLVNVLYMASRASRAATGAEPVSQGMRMFFAAHGVLSLLAFIAFIVLGVLAYQDQKRERWFFREFPTVTWTFVAVWIVSIVTGELIFVFRYLV
jgi:uncharacterized membrane protein YozB (DUF420 family)